MEEGPSGWSPGLRERRPPPRTALADSYPSAYCVSGAVPGTGDSRRQSRRHPARGGVGLCQRQRSFSWEFSSRRADPRDPTSLSRDALRSQMVGFVRDTVRYLSAVAGGSVTLAPGLRGGKSVRETPPGGRAAWPWPWPVPPQGAAYRSLSEASGSQTLGDATRRPQILQRSQPFPGRIRRRLQICRQSSAFRFMASDAGRADRTGSKSLGP